MSKGLEAFANILREADRPYFSVLYDEDMWHEDISIVRKELKALEIIRNDAHIIKDASGEHIVIPIYDIYTPKEEYDLLKEVLL